MCSLFVKLHQIFTSLLPEDLKAVHYEESILTAEPTQGIFEVIGTIDIPKEDMVKRVFNLDSCLRLAKSE